MNDEHLLAPREDDREVQIRISEKRLRVAIIGTVAAGIGTATAIVTVALQLLPIVRAISMKPSAIERSLTVLQMILAKGGG